MAKPIVTKGHLLNGARGRQAIRKLPAAALRRRGMPSDLVIYESIAAAIFEQRLPPSTKLTEETLGAIFGVSRTIVRNALLRLAHDKIVEIRPNRGAVVASPSAEEAQQVFEARRVVEAAIVARAAQVINRAQAARLERITEDERAAHDRGDRRSWVRLSGNFHLELARVAGNEVLADFLRDLVSRTSLIIALRETPMACAAHEHRQVLQTIAAGDTARAIQLMTEHLASCERRLSPADAPPGIDLREVFRDAARGAAPRPARSLRIQRKRAAAAGALPAPRAAAKVRPGGA
ncbi:MAG: GntR family transcriptional regulator [Stellaceae bacterium]